MGRYQRTRCDTSDMARPAYTGTAGFIWEQLPAKKCASSVVTHVVDPKG
jgi:hypothetical protein